MAFAENENFNISVSDVFKENVNGFVGAAVLAEVQNGVDSIALWDEINEITNFISSLSLDDIKCNDNINATRKAYKQLGKDPNRYRPSAEALRRRVVRGLGLYKINNLVDVINFLSLEYGYSIGGFDADKISGNTLTLCVGTSEDLFDGIGRGTLNIENLPLYRDALGGIGTPTSDEERTKITLDTKTLLMLINGYAGNKDLEDCVNKSVELLKKYCDANIISTWTYS